MKILHRISMTEDEPVRLEFERLGFETRCGLTTLLIDESDERWTRVKSLIDKYSPLDIVTTTFTDSEVQIARHLKLVPDWHHGYPQPEGNFEYKSITYDGSRMCADCGSGLVQVSPFRFKREPKWGRRSILQLNWVYDEYFVRPEVWDEVFRPFNVDSREVLHARTEKPLETVVQLVTPRETSSLDLPGHKYEKCCTCGAIRYLPISRGYFPALIGESCSAIFRSREYFGSGHNAFNAIVVTQDLCTAMRERKLKGVKFKPLAEKRG